MKNDNIDYDVLVVGGGIHGVGVAQALAASARSVLVVEQRDLGSGTSSRSSKLIHGGLRYLESAQFHLVRESLREREILSRVAPDLVRWIPFHIPVYRTTRRRPWQLRIGLSLYALLGGLRSRARFRRLRRQEWPRRDGLRGDDLQAVFRYWEAQTDDQRMTVAVMDSARSLGAELACPAHLVAAQREDGFYRAHVETQDGEREVLCRALVNAAGPWIDSVLQSVSPTPPPVKVELVQGAHIVLPGEILEGAYYTEAADGRAVLIMPWRGKTLVGTTETAFEGDPGQLAATEGEIEYLLAGVRHHFPGRATKILETFAGLRVLPVGSGGFSERSRETILAVDQVDSPRLVTIAGGKFTGYRVTAQKVLSLLAGTLPPAKDGADTAQLPLVPPAEITESRKSPQSLPR